MQILYTRTELMNWRRSCRQTVALTPTMGNLHRGHLSLVMQARERASRVLATVFVNPTQFGPNEDFKSYPRTLDRDCQLLQESGADAVFVPEPQEIYPLGLENAFRVQAGPLGEQLCGAHRPGHFDGVVTVVARLFALCRPDVALFGRKDYQQLLMLKRLNEDLGFGIDIVGAETVREPDGLALSSRNQYLSPEERARAPALFRALKAARDALSSGKDRAAAREDGISVLLASEIEAQYFELRRATDLGIPDGSDADNIWLAAAHLGRARLIDNLPC